VWLSETIEMIAIELNINVTTLKRPKDWPPEERLNALHETYSLTGDDLNAWCRERGVFTYQLEQWKIEFCSYGERVTSR
jgi:hypothetical protein